MTVRPAGVGANRPKRSLLRDEEGKLGQRVADALEVPVAHPELRAGLHARNPDQDVEDGNKSALLAEHAGHIAASTPGRPIELDERETTQRKPELLVSWWSHTGKELGDDRPACDDLALVE